MTRLSFACSLLVCLLAAGCSPEKEAAPAPTSAPEAGSDTNVAPPLSVKDIGSAPKPPAPAEEEAATEGTPEEPAPATGDGASVELSSENTKIIFVGAHTDKEKPDPRTCQFNEFTGKISFDKEKLTGIEVEISTESLSSEIDKLTTHLLGPDFFDVRNHPKATFKTTEIKVEDGKTMVVGDMTLLGKTQSISFPAEVTSDSGKVKMDATFDIDRTQFGMNYGLEKIEKAVKMTISVEA